MIKLKKNIYIVILVIALLILVFLFVIQHNKIKFDVNVIIHGIQSNNLTNSEENTLESSVKEIHSEDGVTVPTKDKDLIKDWSLQIPEIGLTAQINEGTTKEIMDKYVGHFKETKKEFGNIGLAAHNRGYAVNYFQNLKKLRKGSEIIYKYGNFEMTYIVEIIEVIENTNWSYLENTEENRITLITCVENEPKYRRCIQGVEKKEREDF